ncbi:MAG: TIGR02221 family CRISPR-associated protein [Thermodesulfobacteriota bacterium]|nr:TIGR02221 family CRISPR-associated protein [Thermodesulfobacteriota bacterium]
MSKIFVSFLGTNEYMECNYCFGDKKVENVSFVQEAMIRMFCTDFGHDDRILIFLTREAREKNWIDTEHHKGLASRLAELPTRARVQDVDIPDGSSEEEIWRIFSVVYEKFAQGDKVVMDITHGFRSLPMLGIILLNYARVISKIEIQGIYYGAFETLGTAFKVKEIPVSKRNAPIFDLTGFDTLMQWSSGAEDFVRFGNPAKISQLLDNAATPRLLQSSGRDKEASHWRNMATQLKELAGQISTDRGAQLTEGKSTGRILEYIDRISSAQEIIPAFQPLLDMIKNKVNGFKENSLENCLTAVGWCIEHNLIQQGLTLLQETVISMVLDKYDLDWHDRDLREIVADCFNAVNRKREEKNWSARLRENPDISRNFISSSLVGSLASDYDSLSQIRNDINHGGFVGQCKADAFKKHLKQKYQAIRKQLTG